MAVNQPLLDPAPTAPSVAPSTAVPPKRRTRKLLVICVVFAILFLIGFLIGALSFIGVLGGNVRTIAAGRAYRSATITGLSYTGISARLVGNDLESVIKRDHIATVISLRGASPSADWYREERDACARSNVQHVDLPMSARSLPPPNIVNGLLDTLDHARYPVLMHCQAGSDRTGLASTIYANVYEKQPLDRAEREELSWQYGHFPVDKTRAMDEFFRLYRTTSDGLDLRTWIRTRYPQIYAARNASASRSH